MRTESRMNGMRVVATILCLGALVGSVVCPWWRYRGDDDLYAAALRFAEESPTMARAGIRPDLETYVGMVPLWDIRGYEVAEWLALPTLFQMAFIVGLWVLALRYARQYDVA